MMKRDHQSQPELSLQAPPSTFHFVETAPSVLREMPWIRLKDSKVGMAVGMALIYINFGAGFWLISQGCKTNV